MNKEEILSKSREENKNKDLYAIKVQEHAASFSAIIALALATLFFVTQALTGGGFNYGLYAIVFSVGATNFVYKAARMKRKRDTVFAVLYTVVAIILTAVHIYQLVAKPAL